MIVLAITENVADSLAALTADFNISTPFCPFTVIFCIGLIIPNTFLIIVHILVMRVALAVLASASPAGPPNAPTATPAAMNPKSIAISSGEYGIPGIISFSQKPASSPSGTFNALWATMPPPTTAPAAALANAPPPTSAT